MRHFSVPRLFKSMVMACIALTSAPLMAVDFDQFQYDVYIGDRNGDGRDDILLVAKDSIIPIHGDVLIPLAVQLTENFVIESGPGFYYDPITLTDAEINLNGFALATNTVIYDYNNDGQLDLVIGQQGTSIGNIALLGGVDSSEDPILIANVDEPDVLSTPPNPGSIGLAESLVNGSILKTSDSLAPIAGEFRVNENGAATYSIPVFSPPGSGGVAPQIALNYSSQSGNGLLGLGWSLGGLSAISRCRQTMATDGHAAPITWSEQDRFCLDGQRLILETGSIYGAVGATYKTEIDSFATITSVGGTLGDPAYFVMVSKDGSTSEYGRVASASFDNTRSQTLNWAVNKFSDSVGNKIDFSYTTTAHSQRISRIDYGSESLNHSAMVFQYETRPEDKVFNYMAGFRIESLHRLTEIQVSSNSTVLRHYKLNYDGINTDFSRVVKIEECSNSDQTNCRRATEFEWQYPIIGFNNSFTELYPDNTSRFSDYDLLDVNGDGFQDLAYVGITQGGSDQVFTYALSDGEGLIRDDTLFSERFGENPGQETVKIEVVDYNADGKSDVLLFNERESNNPWRLFLSELTSEGWRLQDKGRILPFTEEDMMFGDINSDGLVDAYYIAGPMTEGIEVYYLQEDPLLPVNSSQKYHYVRGTDLDTSDIGLDVEFGTTLTPETISSGTDAGFFTTITPLPGSSGDFNSDGRMDFVALIVDAFFSSNGFRGGVESHYGIAVLTQGQNNKIELMEEIQIIDKEKYDYLSRDDVSPIRVFDVNQDGYSDFALQDSSSDTNGNWYLYTNTGEDFIRSSALLPHSLNETVNRSVQFSDINNDGYPDFVSRNSSGTLLRVRYRLEGTNSFSVANNIHGFNQDLTNVEYSLENSNGEAYTEFVSPASTTIVTQDDRNDSYSFLNLDGVGGPDLFFFDASSGDLNIRKNRNSGDTSHVIKVITNGLGAETQIDYAQIHNSEHYQSLSDTVTTGNISDYYQSLNNPFQNFSVFPAVEVAPIMEQKAGVHVVTSVSSSSPIASNQNAKATVDYYYENARLQAAGRGFLGFEKLKTKDMQTGIETTTTYRQDYPFIGSPIKTQTSYDDKLITSSETQWDAFDFTKQDGIRYQPYVSESIDRNFKVSSSFSDGFSIGTEIVSQVETINTYDHYGNPTRIETTTTGDGNTYKQTTTNGFGNSIESKELGRLITSSVIHERNGQTLTRLSEFSYYGMEGSDCSGSFNMRGLLCSETVNVGSPLYALTTSYEYDVYGNQIKANSSAQNEISRISTSSFASYGRYEDQSINHYGQVTQDTISWDAYGNPAEVKNILGVSTQYKYSLMGEQYLEYSATGTFTVSYRRTPDPQGHCPSGTVYQVETKAPDNARTYECVDKVGRSLLTAAQLINNDWTLTKTEYDVLGRVARRSEPYKPGQTIHWTTYSYDVLSNVTRMDQPNYAGNSRINYSRYDGLSKTDTNVLGQNKTEVNNPLGELVQIKDNLNTTVDYEYNPIGDLRFTKTSANGTTHVLEMQYDSYGHRTSSVDPDKGTWSYTYNAFNEVTSQINGNGDARTLEYDQLGRKISRVEPDGTSQWVYNNTNSGNSRGQMEYEVLFDNNSNVLNQMDYTYDSFGRVIEMTTYIDGEEFTERSTYDEYGRNFQSFDAAELQNAMQYQYKNGHMHKVVNASDTNEVYYQANQMDARGNVTQYVQGAVTTDRAYDASTGFLTTVGSTVAGTFGTQDLSYSWDALANLKSRTEKSGNKNLTENFTFDEINRLSSSQVVGRTKQNYHYDAFGNTTFKTGVGDYKYGSACANGAGPHAVCEINNGATTEIFDYDNNGNMLTHRVNGVVDRQFVYSSFDKPTRITKGDHTTEFEYGANRSRYKRIDTSNGESTTTLYVGSVEILTKPNGDREVRRYINGTVLVTQDYNQDANGDYQFARSVTRNILTDHLGSTDVITDLNGQIVQEQSFDAWGARRSTTDGVRLDDLALVSLADVNNEFTTKGFTGHEAVDQVGVIHMNGRIYDARLGRFLQADPNIDGVDTTQGYNRYAYVQNNPLNTTDPTGYFGFKEIATIAAIAVVSIVTYGAATSFFSAAFANAGVFTTTIGANAGLLAGAQVVSGVAVGAFSGAVAGFASGAVGAALYGARGSDILKGGIEGAISGAVFGGIGGSSLGDTARVGAHAVSGGVLNVLKGGKFGHGFISAGVTKYAAVNYISSISGAGLDRILGRTTIASIVGGTVSKLTGGKFANGAQTAATAHLFNSESRNLAGSRSCSNRPCGNRPEGKSLAEQLGVKYSYGTYAGGSAITPGGGVNAGVNGQFFSDGSSDVYGVVGTGWGWDIGAGGEANFAIYLGEGDAGVASWIDRFDSIHLSGFGLTASYFYGGDWHGISFGASSDGFGFSKQINQYNSYSLFGN